MTNTNANLHEIDHQMTWADLGIDFNLDEFDIDAEPDLELDPEIRLATLEAVNYELGLQQLEWEAIENATFNRISPAEKLMWDR